MRHVDHPLYPPVILSFCPGILGLERGLERVLGKLRIAAYCEIEAFLCANLVAGMEAGVLESAPVWTDVKTFPAHLFRGKVQGVTGGYPCQPFSNAGNQKGETDERHLWPYFRRHIAAVKPLWCFFENVANHLNIGYEQVRRELQELGFTVKEGIYSAKEVGAPHRRERLFILAISNGHGYARAKDRRAFGAGKVSSKTWAHQLSELARCRSQWSDERLDYSSGNRSESKYKVSAGGNGPESSGEGLENADIFRQLGPTVPHEQPGGADAFGAGEELDNGIGEGLEGQCGDDGRTQGSAQPYRSVAERGFPMGQGKEQYDWEEPRTTQPGVGSTINGYDFREDLLRALGNSVVEQTAALAFTDLLRKHIHE